jgi:hypothetical protein
LADPEEDSEMMTGSCHAKIGDGPVEIQVGINYVILISLKENDIGIGTISYLFNPRIKHRKSDKFRFFLASCSP